MMKSTQNKAALYAAYKEIERLLENGCGELPPDTEVHVGGVTVSITIPNGTTIRRDAGVNGDGIVKKKATQNLYGWAVLYECFRVAKLFKQHKRLENLLIKIVRNAIRKGISTQNAFSQAMPSKAKDIDDLRKNLPVPMRNEPTPRLVVRENQQVLPVVNVNWKSKEHLVA